MLRSFRPAFAIALGFGVLLAACGRSPEGGTGTSSARPGGPKAASLGVVRPVTPCESLGEVDLTAIGRSGSCVTSASPSTHGEAAVCAVEGVLAPSIGFQLLLPTETWTGRYLQTGCGGLCGSVSLRVGAAEGCAPFESGELALASTDMRRPRRCGSSCFPGWTTASGGRGPTDSIC